MGTSQKVQGLWTMTVGQREASLRALENAIAKEGGDPVALFDLFRTNPAFSTRVAQGMIRGGFEGPVSQRIAKILLGDNIFDPNDWKEFYAAKGIRAPKFPWGEDVLNSPCPLIESKLIKETHFAFLGLPSLNGELLSIQKLMILHPPQQYPERKDPQFYALSYWPEWVYANEELISSAICEPRWYLMPMCPFVVAEGKSFNKQKSMLPVEYEVPHAVEDVLRRVLQWRKLGAYWGPYDAEYDRPLLTADVDSKNARVETDVTSREIHINKTLNFSPRSQRAVVAMSRKLP